METRKHEGIMLALPLALGLLSALSFLICVYSANHAPYGLVNVVYAGPVCSLAGLVVSAITRKERDAHPALWRGGLAVCLLTLVLCGLFLSLLAFVAMAIINGG